MLRCLLLPKQNISRLLGQACLFCTYVERRNYLSPIPCHSSPRYGQDPVPTAGNWSFSTVSSGSWTGLPFPVPKSYQNNTSVRVCVYIIMLIKTKQKQLQLKGAYVLIPEEFKLSSLKLFWKHRDDWCCDRCDFSFVVALIK